MRKKLSAEEIGILLDKFEECIVPWCEENCLSLHQAFEISRASDREKHHVLSALWGTDPGQLFLSEYFRRRGGRLGNNPQK